jgi:hypothetical protein
MLASRKGFHLRALDIAELGPLDLQFVVALLGSVTDFVPDVFAFSITVGPDDESICVSRLVFNVSGDGSLVLSCLSV